MLVLLFWWVFIDVGIAILVSGPMLGLLYWWVVPTCWDYYTGEWSLHVGIAILASCPYMLGLLYWWEFLDVCIAILVSGPYMLGLLYWWVVPTCWDGYTGEWSLHVGIAILAIGTYMLELLYWLVVIYVAILSGELSLYTGIATFARYLFMLALLHWRVGSLYNGIAMLVTQTRGSKEPKNTRLVFIFTFKSNRWSQSTC